MELYIARDKKGSLFLYNNKPICVKDEELFLSDVNSEEDIYCDGIEIDSKLFPEVTYENSPQQVELKLIKNDSNS